MKIGMPTLIEAKSLEESAALCKELGLAFIELNMNLPEFQIHSIDTDRLIRIAGEYGISYTIHLDENLNVSDFNPLVANAYRSTVIKTIELAKTLEIPIINMHLPKGVYFTLPDKRIYLFDKYMDAYLKTLAAFRDECEELLSGSGISICIENSDGYVTEAIRKGLELLLESRAFGLTFDIGHNRSIGGGDEEIIMQCESRLRHMHIHDAAGEKNHLVLGTGELDLHKYFDIAAKHNCSIVLETKTIEGLKQSVSWVNTYIK